jgi:hypothetical protein
MVAFFNTGKLSRYPAPSPNRHQGCKPQLIIAFTKDGISTVDNTPLRTTRMIGFAVLIDRNCRTFLSHLLLIQQLLYLAIIKYFGYKKSKRCFFLIADPAELTPDKLIGTGALRWSSETNVPPSLTLP